MRLSRRGFTIVELLVVMGILALLVSLLAPALMAAREEGRSAQCAANLRQFGIAMHLYLKNNDGLYPPFRLPPNVDGTSPLVEVGTGLKVRPRMPAALGHYLEGAFDEPSTTDERQNYDSPVFSCPSVPQWVDERNFAYGYNYQFLGNTRTLLSNPSAYINWPVPESAVTKTSRTIVMGDCMGSAAAFATNQRERYQPKVNNVRALGNHGLTLDPPYIPLHTGRSYSTADPHVNGYRSALDPRHNGRANCLFADGHVRGMTLAQAGYTVASDGSVTYGFYVDGTGNSVTTATNRYFSGDFTNRHPPTVD